MKKGARIINRRPVVLNPYVPIPAPHELFYRAHQGLGGSWDVRRARYHGKLEILESGLTESKARALAASANQEIRTEREAFFETQPLGSFRNATKSSDPFERFLDLQKQGFMKPAKRKPIIMYRAMTPFGATYTGPNKDIAESHVRQYGGKVETFRE